MSTSLGTRKRLSPESEPHPARAFAGDASTWALLAANGFALAVALVQDWQLAELMAVYWIQSIAIGGSYFVRIMNLEKFSTAGFRINDRPVAPTAKTKRETAVFFLFHYGAFHAAYAVFIVVQSEEGFLLDLGLLACAIAFAIDHAYSYRYNRDADRRGTPNIGTMMFTPYLRVVPMHITLIVGAALMNTAGVLVFGVLKTLADVAMHHVEHRVLGKRSEP